MKRSKKLKNKVSQALYHNSNLQRTVVDLKNSLDEVSGMLEKRTKTKKKG